MIGKKKLCYLVVHITQLPQDRTRFRYSYNSCGSNFSQKKGENTTKITRFIRLECTLIMVVLADLCIHLQQHKNNSSIHLEIVALESTVISLHKIV